MSAKTNQNYSAIGVGNAGNAKAWDIITSTACDLEGKIVSAFMNLEETAGTFTAMKEETTPARAGNAGVSEDVEAKYLAYEYPQNVPFEGRYTTLTPTAGCRFKVWFL